MSTLNELVRPVKWLMTSAGTFTLMVSMANAQAPEAHTQKDIVVSASRIPLSANRVGSAVTVISSEELEQRGDQYVSDVLRDVPGLAVSRTGSYGALTQVRIRGTEGNHTLVVIDGIEVNDQSAGSEFDFGKLLVTDIERIEVLRGSQSALWGSDAIGGVINIVTKKGSGKLKGSVSVEGGSQRTGKAEMSIRGGTDKFHGSFSATQFRTDGISQANKSRGHSEKDGQKISSFQAKLGFTPIDDLEIDFVGRYNRSFLETDAFSGGVGANDADRDTETHQRYGLASVKYGLFDNKWTHQVRAAYSEDKDKSRSNSAISSTAKGTKHKFDYQTTIKYDTPSLAGGEHAVTFLAEEEKDRMSASFLSAGAVETVNHGFAMEYNLTLLDSLHLSASARHDRNDRFQNANTYRGTLAYEFKDWGGRLHSSYGTGVKNPTLTELYGFSANFVGNPNLKTEKNKSWDVGYEQTFMDDRILVDVTYFKNKVTNLITGSGNTAVNQAGTSPSKGIELSAEFEATDDLTLGASYTYNNAKTAAGVQQVRRAKHVASMNVNYAFLDDAANVNLGIDYNGAQKDFEFDASFNRSIVELESYTLVNLNASYDVHENVRLFVRGENLLNEDYEEVLTYGTPGLSVFGGVKVSF